MEKTGTRNLTQEEIKNYLDKLYSTISNERKDMVEKFVSIVEDRVLHLCLASHLLYPVTLKTGEVPAIENVPKYKAEEIWESRDFDSHDGQCDATMYNMAKGEKEDRTGKISDRIFFCEISIESQVSVSLNEFMQKSYAPIDRIFEKVPHDIAGQLNRMFYNCLHDIVIAKEPVTLRPKMASSVLNFLRKRDDDAEKVKEPELTVEVMKAKALTISGARTLLVPGDIYIQHKSVIKAYHEATEMSLKIASGLGNDFIYFLPASEKLGYFATRFTTQVLDADHAKSGEAKYGWNFLRGQGIVMFSRDVAGIRV